jgi:hypothetical protein
MSSMATSMRLGPRLALFKAQVSDACVEPESERHTETHQVTFSFLSIMVFPAHWGPMVMTNGGLSGSKMDDSKDWAARRTIWTKKRIRHCLVGTWHSVR